MEDFGSHRCELIGHVAGDPAAEGVSAPAETRWAENSQNDEKKRMNDRLEYRTGAGHGNDKLRRGLR